MKQKNTAIIWIALFIVSFFPLSGCKKAMESAVDCIGESFFVSLKTVANADNPKIVNLEVHYSGSHTFTSVNWTYGDGATAESTTTSTQHTYTTAGSYTVKASVSIQKNGSTCTSDHTKVIVIPD